MKKHIILTLLAVFILTNVSFAEEKTKLPSYVREIYERAERTYTYMYKFGAFDFLSFQLTVVKNEKTGEITPVMRWYMANSSEYFYATSAIIVIGDDSFEYELKDRQESYTSSQFGTTYSETYFTVLTDKQIEELVTAINGMDKKSKPFIRFKSRNGKDDEFYQKKLGEGFKAMAEFYFSLKNDKQTAK